jgi:hypothetical protein
VITKSTPIVTVSIVVGGEVGAGDGTFDGAAVG